MAHTKHCTNSCVPTRTHGHMACTKHCTNSCMHIYSNTAVMLTFASMLLSDKLSACSTVLAASAAPSAAAGAPPRLQCATAPSSDASCCSTCGRPSRSRRTKPADRQLFYAACLLRRTKCFRSRGQHRMCAHTLRQAGFATALKSPQQYASTCDTGGSPISEHLRRYTAPPPPGLPLT